MITHFAELELQTVSREGARQVYADRLGFPIGNEDDRSVTFDITPFTRLQFVEADAPLSPAHVAFQVAYDGFPDALEALLASGVLVISDPIDTGVKRQVYFRDGDGNLLELLAFDYVVEDAFPPRHPLNVLYVREIGFPVEDVDASRAWMTNALSLRLSDNATPSFGFMIGGTAHAVVVDRRRPWIPIGIRALPPPMRLTWGTPDRSFVDAAAERLGDVPTEVIDNPTSVSFEREGYRLRVAHTPEVTAEQVDTLNLP